MSEVKEKVSLGNVQQKNEAPPMWDVPVTEVMLPSEGKVYGENSPLHGLKSLQIRAMTAREEDILTSPALLKQGKAMSALLKNCIVDKSIDPDEMIVGDRNAVLIAIRVSGYGPEYDARVTCSVCDESFDNTFNVGELPTINLKQDPDITGENCFSFKLPVSKKDVKFKLLNGQEERDLSNTQAKIKKAKGVQAVENNVTTRLFHQLISIGSETDRSKLKKLVETMVAADARALRKYMDNLAPGINMKQDVSCPSCGEESEVDMPIGANFFWPEL